MGESHALKNSDFGCILFALHSKPFFWHVGFKKTASGAEQKVHNRNNFSSEYTILLLLKIRLICFIRFNSLPLSFNLKRH